MPKHKIKTFVSKRQNYRRIAAEVQEIIQDVTENAGNLNYCLISDSSNSDLNQSQTNNHDSSNFQEMASNIESDNFLGDGLYSFQESINADLNDEVFSVSSVSYNSDCESVLVAVQNQHNGTDEESCASQETLTSQLRQWATSQCISHTAIKSLLHILVPFHPELPLDSRTLLQTPRSFESKKLETGEYVHLGLARALQLFLQRHTKFHESVLKISFNIDGLPLYKSSNVQVWPILGLIKNYDSQPFIIGIFCGTSKPKPLRAFLEDFVNELSLIQTVFLFREKRYSIQIHSIVCDAPAKAFIKCIKSPGGYSCCDKCTETGEYVKGRVVLKGLASPKRTDASFRSQLDDGHHLDLSPLLELPIDMINHFPIDYMHNVCLGVVRKLLNCWVGGNLKVRLSGRLTLLLSSKLLHLKDHIPKEIIRKPRALSELPRFKATEFRTFLLYTGVVVLLDIVDVAVYNHFLLLHSAIAVLISTQVISTTHAEKYHLVSSLINTFIKHSETLYGPEFLIYNVHVLSHLSDDASRYGSLDVFSAFPYENYLGQIKRMVRSSKKPLHQICRRIHELDSAFMNVETSLPDDTITFENEHNSGPILSHSFHKQFRRIQMNNYVFSIHSHSKADCFCFNETYVIQIENILKSETGETVVIGRYFKSFTSFYKYPFDSLHLNIRLVDKTLSNEIKAWQFSEIKGKCLLLPYKNNWVSIPLFHTM